MRMGIIIENCASIESAELTPTAAPGAATYLQYLYLEKSNIFMFNHFDK